jgi:hypothetical protein
MPRTGNNNRVPVKLALLVVPLACLGLGACGSSSNKTSSNASTPASTHTAETTPSSSSTATSTTPGATTPTATTPASTTPNTTSTSTEPTITSRQQFAGIYECLRHNGIGLPPLNRVKSLGTLKVNTNTPQYKSVLAKCRKEILG